jgi:hypothetical protein
MPVLRMPGDDTLGSTLGSMADAWGQAYDPMARARAAQMGQQIQLSQFDLQKQKAIDAQNANAATVYMNIPHPNDDPATVAETAAAIRAGNYNPEQWTNAATGLAKLNANRTAAGALTPGSPDTAGMTPGQIADARAQVLGGASLPTYQSQVAGATTDIAKTAATLNASRAAGNATAANMPDLARALAAAQAFTSPKEALITAAGGNVAAGANATSPADLANVRANTTLFAGQPIAAGTPVNQPDVANVRAADTAGKVTVAGAEAMARPRSPQDISAGFVADPNNPNAPVTYVQPGEPTPNVPPGATLTPPRAPNLGTVQDIASAEAAGKEGGEATAKNNNVVINEAQAGGYRAQQLDTKVQRLREVLPFLNNQNPFQQVGGDLANEIQQEFGITIGPGQSARNVYNVMVNQLLPELKDDYGFQRVAAPEIALAQGGMPMGSLDAASLTRIVNALDASAQLNKRVAQMATQARAGSGVGGITPGAYNNFIAQREALNPMDFLNQVRQAHPEAPLTPSAAERPHAPNVSLPAMKFDPGTNQWLHLNPATGQYAPRQ